MNVYITIFNILHTFGLLGYFQWFGNINNVGWNSGILIFVHMFYSSLWRTSLDVGLPVQNRNLFKPLQDCHPKCFTIYTPQGSAQKCFQGSRQPWILLLVKIWSLWWWQIILINVVAWLLGSWIIYCKIFICSFFLLQNALMPSLLGGPNDFWAPHDSPQAGAPTSGGGFNLVPCFLIFGRAVPHTAAPLWVGRALSRGED